MGSGFGIASLILGILGIAAPWIGVFIPFFPGFVGIVLSILAIIFGIIGIAKDDSKAPGIIGLIFGIIGIIIWIFAALILVWFINNINP